jgi:hypothetical protein
MATTPADASALPVPSGGTPRESGSGPVAVVWCRQVDNEAESPGYTTIPESFSGREETLEIIRLVGNLTVNVADTQDYWAPGPPQPLSYYPNLFLYPAFQGRYLCVGRMFLSTEDRPRLGMKTLVLETSKLLASGDFGAAVLHWWASMAGGKGDGRRPPVPAPTLYPLLGEGLLFHRGDSAPVLAVASGQWESAMEVIFDLVRSVPAALLELGAILAFPYFLPQPKTNLSEFTEEVPLALGLMRIPEAEARGDRHKKRLANWYATSLTFRDLTAAPAPSGKGKDAVPLFLQYVRDHQTDKLQQISQRVDAVELPRIQGFLADPDRQSGRERRKEMAKIASAMESATVLLAKGKPKHLPVNSEVARRAQAYVKVTPGPLVDSDPSPDPVLAPPPDVSGGIPSWLSKGVDPASAPAAPTAPGVPEVVPVSKSDDPSIQPPAPAAPTIDMDAVRREIAAAQERFVAGRFQELQAGLGAVVTARLGSDLPTAVRPLLESQLALARAEMRREAEEIVRTFVGSTPPPSLSEVKGAIASELDQRLPKRAEVERTLLEETTARLDARLREVSERMESRLAAEVQAKLAELTPPLRTGLATAVSERVDTKFAEAAPKIESRVAAEVGPKLDARLGELARRMEARLLELETRGAQAAVGSAGEAAKRFDQRLTDLELRSTRETAAALLELQKKIDSRLSELETKAGQLTASSVAAAEGRIRSGLVGSVATEIDRRVTATLARELQENPKGAIAERIDGRVDAAVRLADRSKDARIDAAVMSLETRLESRLKALQVAAPPSTARLMESLQPGIDTRILAALEEPKRSIEELRKELAERTDALRSRVQGDLTERLRDALAKETLARAADIEELTKHLEAKVNGLAARPPPGLAELEGRISEQVEMRVRDLQNRAVTAAKEIDQRLAGVTQEMDGKIRELQSELETRIRASGEERAQLAESNLSGVLESRLAESRELQARASSDLQLRVQAYADQKLRDSEERTRQTMVELLGRMRQEVEATVARGSDPARIEQLVKDRLFRALETLRADLERATDQKLVDSEQRVQESVRESLQRFETLQREIRGQTKELLKIEQAMHTEIDDLDERLVALSDRLVPVVRKTWLRISEIEKAPGGAPELEGRLTQLRRELKEEFRHVETEQAERIREIRDRTEEMIQRQGKVWLSIVRNLSVLAGDRRPEGAEPERVAPRSTPRYPPSMEEAEPEPEPEPLASVPEPAMEDEPPRRRPTRRLTR